MAKVYERSDVFTSSIDDDMVLFDPDAGYYYSTGAVGRSIWAHLDQPLHLEELVERLTREYDVDRDVCRQDVRGFLEHLSELGLIRGREQ